MSEIQQKTKHIHILMSPEEVEAIDDWSFKNRIRTRGEAIRRLCRIGLGLENSEADSDTAKR